MVTLAGTHVNDPHLVSSSWRHFFFAHGITSFHYLVTLHAPVERVRGDAGGRVVRGAPVGDVGAAGHADDARAGPGGHLQGGSRKC